MPTAHFDSFTPEITTPEAYEYVYVKPIQNRINGDVMGVRWLREDGTWKIIRIEDIAYLEEILDDRMSFAAYPPSALKYLNDTNPILSWDFVRKRISDIVCLLTQRPDPISSDAQYPVNYRPFVYPRYSGDIVPKLEIADFSLPYYTLLGDTFTDETSAKAWWIKYFTGSGAALTQRRADPNADNLYRVWGTEYYQSLEGQIRPPDQKKFPPLAEMILFWYAFIQQMDIFFGADTNLSDETTFQMLLPSFEQNQQLVDSWHDRTRLVPAQKFSRDRSSSFSVSSVNVPITFAYEHPEIDSETFYIYQEPYRIYMNPRYTGRIAEMSALLFFKITMEGNTVVRPLWAQMVYSGMETDVFGEGTESEVWAISMALNNTLLFRNKISTGASISTDTSPLYMIRLARERGKRRYAFQAFVLVEWENSDVDICAFWSGWDSTKYVGYGWGSNPTLNGFSSTWNSSDNTQGGPEYVSIAYDSDEPPPNSSSFEVHCNWYRYTSGATTAKVTCFDQFGGMRTATILPSTHGGKTQPDDPGVRFNFDSAGQLTGVSFV